MCEAAQACLRRGDEKQATEHFTYFLHRYPHAQMRPMVLYALGNRQILYHADTKAAWVYYGQLLDEYPQHVLAERARVFWAALSKLPHAKLEEQVANFLKHHPLHNHQ